MKDYSDPELLVLIQDNNEQAFAIIAQRYQIQLYRQIYKRLRSDNYEVKKYLTATGISLNSFDDLGTLLRTFF